MGQGRVVPSFHGRCGRAWCRGDSVRDQQFGIWGGMTERERHALLRCRPTVTFWRTLLETARLEHEQQVGVGTGHGGGPGQLPAAS